MHPASHLGQLQGSVIFDSISLAAIALLTLAGVMLRLYLPRHRVETEERIKNNKMTEEEARRQVRLYETCSQWITLIAVILLLAVLLDLAI